MVEIKTDAHGPVWTYFLEFITRRSWVQIPPLAGSERNE
jgi:hypothetical protein